MIMLGIALGIITATPYVYFLISLFSYSGGSDLGTDHFIPVILMLMAIFLVVLGVFIYSDSRD